MAISASALRRALKSALARDAALTIGISGGIGALGHAGASPIEDDPQERDAMGDFGAALAGGAVQGGTLAYGDELGIMDDLGERRAHAPIAFSIGEAIGAVPYAFLGARLARTQLRSKLAKLLLAAGVGGVHGAAAGSGAGEQENASIGDRLRSAALGASIGGAVGGLAVPFTKAGVDVADNLPALTGRRALVEGGFERVAPGMGTRRSAPVRVNLAGEGDASTRAERALAAALQLDEGLEAARSGASKLGRFTDDGRTITPFTSPNAGRSLRSLSDYAAQSPGGAAKLNAMADDALIESLSGQMRRMRAPAAPTGLKTRPAPLARADRDDLIAAFDDPNAHGSWVSEVRNLSATQRARLARDIVANVKARFRAVGTPEAEGFRTWLRDERTVAKLEALGVRFTKGRKPLPVDDEVENYITSLRSRATRSENPAYADAERGFGNVEDRLLAQMGALDEADALALLQAASRPRRAYYVSPDRNARLLDGAYEQGARFNPRGWLDASAGELEAATAAAQPAAALLHGADRWFEDRPSEEEEIRRRRRQIRPYGPLVAGA